MNSTQAGHASHTGHAGHAGHASGARAGCRAQRPWQGLLPKLGWRSAVGGRAHAARSRRKKWLGMLGVLDSVGG